MSEKRAFWQALQQGDTEKVMQLVTRQPRLVESENEAGVSPIVFAAYHKHFALADQLANFKVALNVFEAAVCGRVSTLMRLLAREPGLVNAFQADGVQPLILACLGGRMEAVRFLLKAGAAVNSPTRNDLRLTPLHVAVQAGDAALVRLLLTHNADPNVRQKDGVTPTHLAAQQGDVDILRMLIFYGADIHLKTDAGDTPVDLAQAAGHAEAVTLLRSEITKRLRQNPQTV